MIFKRKKSAQQSPAEEPVAQSPVVEEAPAPVTEGPWDITDIQNPDEYLNFGSLLIKPLSGMKVRMDMEEKTKRVISLSLEVAESRVQLQAFARSKSQELWPGISNKIAQDISKQNGELYTRDGELGKELLAKVPQQMPDGSAGHVALRFIGVDGPRWFLRIVVGGAAISNEQAAGIVDELVRGVVVDRGTTPLPPQELLPLNVPNNVTTKPEPAPDASGVQRPERGPEITQIG